MDIKIGKPIYEKSGNKDIVIRYRLVKDEIHLGKLKAKIVELRGALETPAERTKEQRERLERMLRERKDILKDIEKL